MPGYHVLIIDDDETTHDILGEYLHLAGYEVLHARDGQEGLYRLESAPCDLVLLDIQMPDLDGFQVISLLKKSERFADIPVIFLSSLDRPNLKVKGLELGAEDYMVKPFNRAELLARVKGALRRSARYRAISAGLEGDLAEVGIADLLQTLEIGRKSARITFDRIDGEMVLADGMIVAVRQSGFTGFPAFQRLLFLERGRFAVSFTAAGESADGFTVRDALMTSLTLVDEARHLIAGVGPEAVLAAVADLPEPFRDVAPLLPATCQELVTRMPGDLKENAAAVARACREGILKPVA